MRILGLTYAIAAAVTWGLSYTIDQKVLGKVSPLAFLFITSILAFLITLPFVLSDKQSLKTLLGSGRLNLSLIVAAVALATLANYFIFSSIKILGAPTASIFEIAYPFFVVLFSFFVFGATPNVFFLIGAALIFLGSLVIIRFG